MCYRIALRYTKEDRYLTRIKSHIGYILGMTADSRQYIVRDSPEEEGTPIAIISPHYFQIKLATGQPAAEVLESSSSKITDRERRGYLFSMEESSEEGKDIIIDGDVFLSGLKMMASHLLQALPDAENDGHSSDGSSSSDDSSNSSGDDSSSSSSDDSSPEIQVLTAPVSELETLLQRMEQGDPIPADLTIFAVIDLGTMAAKTGRPSLHQHCQRFVFHKLTVPESYGALKYAYQPEHVKTMFPAVLAFCHKHIKEIVKNKEELKTLGMWLMQEMVDISLDHYTPPAWL